MPVCSFSSGRPLYEQYYSLSESESAFYKRQTGIEDDAVLKDHILSVAKEAYTWHEYGTIRVLAFTRIPLSQLDAYPSFLKLGNERKGALYLELGACFGTDVRKAVADGFPVNQIIASDLREPFWLLGHKLFKSTPKSFPVPFIEGNIFDSDMVTIQPPLKAAALDPPPSLVGLKSLNPLRGYISAIHCSHFFHLFTEAQQRDVALALAGLLSPLPGSMILGMQIASNDDKGTWVDHFCQTPDSWAELWREVFGKNRVKVETRMQVECDEDFLGEKLADGKKLYIMIWSVTVQEAA